MFKYPAKITYNKTDNTYYVKFPDLPNCFTDGETLEEALERAAEVLSLYLESVHENNFKFSDPSHVSGKNIYYISPELNVSFAILLRKERESKHLSQKQIAEKLDISYQAYQRYENPRKANPTLKTIAKVENILGKSLVTI
jgi:antitoxin HicB